MYRAGSFMDRYLGLKRAGPVLMRAQSVHGFGMDRPFQAVGLSSALAVKAVKMVEPNRIAIFPGCRYVLELPLSVSAPDLGTELEMIDG